MTQTDPETVDAARRTSVLRCRALPPLTAQPPRAISGRRSSGIPMLRRGLVALAALALPALGAALADPVHRARLPQATQAAAAPRSPLGEAAAATLGARRIVVGALDSADPVVAR